MAGLFEQLSLWFTDPAPAAGDRPATAAGPSASSPRPTPSGEAASVLRHPQGDREIVLEGQRLAYALRRARRRTIGFTVGTEGLSVSAPRWVSVGDIESAIRDKGAWILRKLQEQDERRRRLEAARIVWADGARVPFIGRSLTLVLDPQRVPSPGGALLDEERLLVGLPADAQAERIRDAVHGWWQRQARRVFEERCAVYAPRLGVQVRRLALSSAQTRWGSAGADGSIRLNWRLIHFPLSSIDYVVVHELAHLREMNHSAAFWEVVRSVLPEYESAQAPLKQAPPALD